MPILKQPLALPVFRHKSATTFHIKSSNVPNSKLKPDLCKTETAEATPLPQLSRKPSRIMLRHPISSQSYVSMNRGIQILPQHDVLSDLECLAKLRDSV